MVLQRSLALASALAALIACSGGAGTPANPPAGSAGAGGPFSVTASSQGSLPPGGKIAIVWSVSFGDPDYGYIFGTGSVQGAQASLSFDSAPPADALNAGKLGVGVVVVVDANTALPDGKLTGELTFPMSAAAPDYAVVYRNTTEKVLDNGWDENFPQGFACGQCVHHDSGFDTFAVVDCSAVKLVAYSKGLKFCNWT
jgi:hypothetical protein